MEAVAADTFGVKVFRYREVIGDRAMRAMKRGIEAGDLRQIRPARKHRTYRRQIVGLVQRRERNVTLEMREHLRVDQDRSIVFGTAVNNAVADRDEIEGLRLAQPIAGGDDRRGNVADLPLIVSFIDQRRAVAAFGT